MEIENESENEIEIEIESEKRNPIFAWGNQRGQGWGNQGERKQ